jgi:hypothetical protein
VRCHEFDRLLASHLAGIGESIFSQLNATLRSNAPPNNCDELQQKLAFALLFSLQGE